MYNKRDGLSLHIVISSDDREHGSKAAGPNRRPGFKAGMPAPGLVT